MDNNDIINFIKTNANYEDTRICSMAFINSIKDMHNLIFDSIKYNVINMKFYLTLICNGRKRVIEIKDFYWDYVGFLKNIKMQLQGVTIYDSRFKT